MSHKRRRKKRSRANTPKTTHVIERSTAARPDTTSAPPSENPVLPEERTAEKQTAEKRAAEKQEAQNREAEKLAVKEAVSFPSEKRSSFSPARLLRPALTAAGAAVCLLVIMYFNARMAGSYPGQRIFSALHGNSTQTNSAPPEESPSTSNAENVPAAETEAETQKIDIMSENAAVEKTDNSPSRSADEGNTAETAEEEEEEYEEEYDEEYEEEYEDEEYYEDEDEYEYEDEEYEYEDEDEYEDEAGELYDEIN